MMGECIVYIKLNKNGIILKKHIFCTKRVFFMYMNIVHMRMIRGG